MERPYCGLLCRKTAVSEQPWRPLPPAPPPLLQGEGRVPPSLAGKGVRGLGFLNHIFKLDTALLTTKVLNTSQSNNRI